MWFVEIEGPKGWEVALNVEDYTVAMDRFMVLLRELNHAESRGEDLSYVALRIEYRR